MKALIDTDSIVYKSFYIHYEKYKEGEIKDIVSEVVFTAESMVFNILDEAERQGGFDLNDYHFFFTTCTNNFRNVISKDYKSNRGEKPKELYESLSAFMEVLTENYGVYYSDTLEADDLIPLFIKENRLNTSDYVIVRMDKDLSQIEGFHFNYFKDKTGRYKGLSYINRPNAFKNFCKLALMGDSSDNIKGLKGVGDVRSERILKDRSEFGMWRKVVESYLKDSGGKEKLKKNVKLIRL